MDLGQLRTRVAKNDRFVEAMQLAAFTQTCYKFARAAYSHGPICKDLKSNCAKKIVVFQQPSTNQPISLLQVWPGSVSTPVLDQLSKLWPQYLSHLDLFFCRRTLYFLPTTASSLTWASAMLSTGGTSTSTTGRSSVRGGSSPSMRSTSLMKSRWCEDDQLGCQHVSSFPFHSTGWRETTLAARSRTTATTSAAPPSTAMETLTQTHRSMVRTFTVCWPCFEIIIDGKSHTLTPPSNQTKQHKRPML